MKTDLCKVATGEPSRVQESMYLTLRLSRPPQHAKLEPAAKKSKSSSSPCVDADRRCVEHKSLTVGRTRYTRPKSEASTRGLLVNFAKERRTRRRPSG